MTEQTFVALIMWIIGLGLLGFVMYIINEESKI